MNTEKIDVELQSTPSPLQPNDGIRLQGQNRLTASFKASLFSTTPITPSESYKKGVSDERRLFIMMEMIVAIAGPLVFRFVIAAGEEGEGDIDYFEGFILFVMFLDTISWLYKGLPMLSGSPTDVESSMSCHVEGKVVLGCCSPFVAEDEAIFFRSLLGRSCTLFSTCTSRHNIRGLYVDTILNEKRFPGEENRRNMWFAWQKFLASVVDICESRATKEDLSPSNSGVNDASMASVTQSESFRRNSVMRNLRLGSIFQAPSMYTQFLESTKEESNSEFTTAAAAAKTGALQNSLLSVFEEGAEPTTAAAATVAAPPAKRSRLTSLFSKEKYAPEEGITEKRNESVSMAKQGSGLGSGNGSVAGGAQVARKKSRMASLYATNPIDMYTVVEKETDSEATASDGVVSGSVSASSGKEEEGGSRISWRKSASAEHGSKKQVHIQLNPQE
jgi:hypothetical protein